MRQNFWLHFEKKHVGLSICIHTFCRRVAIRCPSSSAPVMQKNKFKINTRKIQKVLFFCMVDNLVREVHSKFALQISNYLDKWVGLGKKDKFEVCKKVYCSCTVLTWFVFFAESCSNVQMSCNLQRTSRNTLSTTHKKWFFFEFF